MPQAASKRSISLIKHIWQYSEPKHIIYGWETWSNIKKKVLFERNWTAYLCVANVTEKFYTAFPFLIFSRLCVPFSDFRIVVSTTFERTLCTICCYSDKSGGKYRYSTNFFTVKRYFFFIHSVILLWQFSRCFRMLHMGLSVPEWDKWIRVKFVVI